MMPLTSYKCYVEHVYGQSRNCVFALFGRCTMPIVEDLLHSVFQTNETFLCPSTTEILP
jgi:hypothetical protein